MEPLGQGRLDSLCGVYGIVNAERYLNGTPEEDSKALFRKIIFKLQEEEKLAEALTEGMSMRHLALIFNEVIKDRIPYRKIAFAGVPTPDLDTFWRKMTTFLDEGPKRAVLLGFGSNSEGWGHWTVVHRITPKQMQLFDSMNPEPKKLLNRIHCTTSDRVDRAYMLSPAQTYLLGKG